MLIYDILFINWCQTQSLKPLSSWWYCCLKSSPNNLFHGTFCEVLANFLIKKFSVQWFIKLDQVKSCHLLLDWDIYITLCEKTLFFLIENCLNLLILVWLDNRFSFYEEFLLNYKIYSLKFDTLLEIIL